MLLNTGIQRLTGKLNIAEVGKHVVLQVATFIDASVGPSAWSEPNAKENLPGEVVEKHAEVGANCTLLAGEIIGANSLIGAGSVVTGGIPPGIVAYGQPANPSRSIDY